MILKFVVQLAIGLKWDLQNLCATLCYIFLLPVFRETVRNCEVITNLRPTHLSDYFLCIIHPTNADLQRQTDNPCYLKNDSHGHRRRRTHVFVILYSVELTGQVVPETSAHNPGTENRHSVRNRIYFYRYLS
jgi:hypothetical protein